MPPAWQPPSPPLAWKPFRGAATSPRRSVLTRLLPTWSASCGGSRTRVAELRRFHVGRDYDTAHPGRVHPAGGELAARSAHRRERVERGRCTRTTGSERHVGEPPPAEPPRRVDGASHPKLWRRRLRRSVAGRRADGAVLHRAGGGAALLAGAL